MVGGLKGEEWKFIQKNIWRKDLKESMHKYREALRTISHVKTRSARFRICTQRAAKLLRSKRLTSQRCEVVFQLVVFGFHHDGKLQKEFHSTVQKWLWNSRSKRLISQPCKNLPSTWSDLLVMAVTPSFQLRIVHHLKHWIVDFLSFKMIYSM